MLRRKINIVVKSKRANIRYVRNPQMVLMNTVRNALAWEKFQIEFLKLWSRLWPFIEPFIRPKSPRIFSILNNMDMFTTFFAIYRRQWILLNFLFPLFGEGKFIDSLVRGNLKFEKKIVVLTVPLKSCAQRN